MKVRGDGMKMQYGGVISNSYFPISMKTPFMDIKGTPLSVGVVVMMTGSKESYGIIGTSCDKTNSVQFGIYFEVERTYHPRKYTTVMWQLTQEVIEKYRITRIIGG